MFRLADVNLSRADDNCLEKKKQEFQQYHKNRSRSTGIYIDWGIEVIAYPKDKQTYFQQFLYTWLFYPHVTFVLQHIQTILPCLSFVSV